MLAKKETLSWSDSIKKFYGEKIDSGFQVSDKAKADELLKLGLEETHKSHSHRTKAKKFLQQIMTDKGISVSDKGFKQKVEGLNVKLTSVPKAAGVPTQDSSGIPTAGTKTLTIKSPIGGLEITTQTPVSGTATTGAVPSQHSAYEQFVAQQKQVAATAQRPILDPKVEKEYKDLFKYGTDLLSKVYIQTGIVESEEMHEKPKIMKAKEWKEELEEFGSNVAGYCFRHNIAIPTFIELFLLGAQGFFVLGSPLIMFFLAGRKSGKEAKLDKTLSKIPEPEQKKEETKSEIMSKIPNIENETKTLSEKEITNLVDKIGGDNPE